MMADASADERTPLITHDGQPSAFTVADEAERVLGTLRSDSEAPTEISDPDAELAILLYAYLRVHESHDRPLTLDWCIGHRDQQRVGQEVIPRLDNEIAGLLYQGGSSSPGADPVTVFSQQHTLDRSGRRVSALDLLALPIDNVPSDVLGHPLVHLVLQQLWATGDSRETMRRGVLGTVQHWITPRRLHLWHFTAFAALWTLTLAIAIRPQRWVTPYEQESDKGIKLKPTALEITWLIFALGLAVQSLQRGFRWLSLPTAIAACLAVLRVTREYAYPALLVSIPSLTLSLIRPSPPSIPFLLPSLLPHSIILFGSLRRSVRGWALAVPLVLALFVVFSISMNGDLSRGFLVLLTPVESGVAPFEARVTISLTLVMLVYLALVIAFLRGPRVTDRGLRSEVWDVGHGGLVAPDARIKWIHGIRWLSGDSASETKVMLDPPALPVPLNILLVPLDVALVISRSVSRLEPSSLSVMVSRIRFTIATGLAGCLCWPIWLIEHLLGRIQR